MTLNPVIIFGAKGLGPVALDLFRSNDIVVYGFLDDDATLHGTEVGDVTVLGATDDQSFLKLIGAKCDAFIAVDDIRIRKNLTELLLEERKVQPITAVHASAYIAPSAELGYGTLIGPGAIVNSQAKLGQHVLVQAGAVIDTDATIGDFSNIGARSLVGAGATLEQEVFIGGGAVIVPGITLGKQARVGAGSVVVEPVKAKTTVFGNPAAKV
jgi:sugar O-acyltransferase (sialic acid O-acetyltransferase NeuD family)